MNQWVFVFAAYLVVLVGLAGLLGWAFAAMRRAEAKAESLSERS